MVESRDTNAEHARTASQIEADVGVEHIAAVYAKALLDAVQNIDQAAARIEEFDALIADVFDRFPKLESVLVSPLVSPDEKAGILDRVLKGRASDVLVNFLKVVAQHDRLDCLRAIHSQTHALYNQLRNRISVKLTTAVPLSSGEATRIVAGLRAQLGGEPVLEQQVDPDLIGGAVLRVGDTVYDGSIANQLLNLRQQMIDRNAHEIQGRRDRFRHSTGN